MRKGRKKENKKDVSGIKDANLARYRPKNLLFPKI
jgi:hypothetical protein